MTSLSEVANLDWNGGIVSLNRADVGSGILKWLATVIHRLWDTINIDLGRIEDADPENDPTGGCCSF